MKSKFRNLGLGILVIVLICSVALFAGCKDKNGEVSSVASDFDGADVSFGNVNYPETVVPDDNKCEIKVSVICNEEVQDFNLKTAHTVLSKALDEAGITDYSEEGIYVRFHSFSVDNAHRWEVKVNGVVTDKGINDITVEEGARYEFTYTAIK